MVFNMMESTDACLGISMPLPTCRSGIRMTTTWAKMDQGHDEVAKQKASLESLRTDHVQHKHKQPKHQRDVLHIQLCKA